MAKPSKEGGKEPIFWLQNKLLDLLGLNDLIYTFQIASSSSAFTEQPQERKRYEVSAHTEDW